MAVYKKFNLFWKEIDGDSLGPNTRDVMIFSWEGKQYQLFQCYYSCTGERPVGPLDIPFPIDEWKIRTTALLKEMSRDLISDFTETENEND